MSDSEKEKDVSCFKVDGVVAEMMIEVEENQKSSLDDLKDLSSPVKDVSVSSDAREEDHDSEKRIEDNVKQYDEMEIENREDKENFLEVSETEEMSDDLKEDQNTDKNVDKADSPNVRRKRKRELAESYKEMNNKVDASKYSEPKKRKLANDSKDAKNVTKVSSDDKQSKKSTQIHEESDPSINEVSDSLTEEFTSDNKNNSLSDKAEPSYEIKKEVEEEVAKQNVLRKLPFRRNKNAPDIPDLKPPVYWYNGVGEGGGAKLGDIPDITKRIKQAKNVRALYRVLFYQWPTNGQDLVKQILEFNGFPFDKSSYEFNKRKSIMKIMLDITISNICDLLDLKKGDKMFMINNVLNFLLRPYKKIDPSLEPSLQPVVRLERLDLGGKFFDQYVEKYKQNMIEATTKGNFPLSRNKSKVEPTPVRETRHSKSSVKLVSKSDSKKPVNEDLNSDETKPAKRKAGRPPSKPALVEKTTRKSGRPPLTKPVLTEKSISKRGRPLLSKPVATEESTPKPKDFKSKTTPAAKDDKSSSKEVKSDDKRALQSEEKPQNAVKLSEKTAAVKLKNKGHKKKMKVKISVKKKEMQTTSDKEIKKKSEETKEKESIENKSKEKTLSNESEDVAFDADFSGDQDIIKDTEKKDGEKQKESSQVTTEKSNKTSGSKKKVTIMPSVTLSDSSETESAEETKLMTAPQKTKFPKKHSGKPLGLFPNISECIQRANFSALQRLHILLFGASDKADNLKANILAFAGFPFNEGSDEWKQKHFLLSLLAMNNLREYLNLLCIEYSDDDQPTMINKLMKFLAAPSDKSDEMNIPEIETEVVSSELTNKSPSATAANKGKGGKKKIKKKEVKKGPRHRKVLMSEEEARRLEASFAREQRAIAREQKAPPPVIKNQIVTNIPPSTSTYQPIKPLPVHQRKTVALIKPAVADARELNALLQTVYKRRALKAAGAIVSLPDKGQKTKLGDLENVKFLIVTGSLLDLEVLHRLIFMMEASKSRIRKNILDFVGFGFNEDSPKYKQRIDYLNRMGYDVSKRISFLLGLCTLQTEIPQQDLNELIMYFLMSPCKTKQVVPITEMPIVPTLGTFDESQLSKSSSDFDVPSYQPVLMTNQVLLPTTLTSNTFDAEIIQTSTPAKSNHQKARKSFPSALKVSPVKKVLLPPSHLPVVGAVLTKQAFGNKSPMTLLNSIPAVPSYTLAKPTTANLLNPPNNVTALNAARTLPNANSYVNIPLISAPKVQLVTHGSNVAVIDSVPKFPTGAVSNTTGQVIQNKVILSQVPPNMVQPQNIIKAPLIAGSSLLKRPTGFTPSGPQEYLVQQQTPDGQQKTFKLIRLPSDHPLASTMGKPVQTVVSTPGQQPVILASSQPSLVVMKENPGLLSAVQKLQTNLQNVSNKVAISNSVSPKPVNVAVANSPQLILPSTNLSDSEPAKPAENPDEQVKSPVKNSPPTDGQLFSSIQEVILSSNFEDITLRNVIERVSAQFADHDLTPRHGFMKECVKKIIIGT